MANRKHPLGLIVLSFLLGWLAISQPAGAQSYNRFQPATGVLVGDASTYVTTAATSANIIGLWSGTCNVSAVLKGDGSCAAASTGTVTSVALTVPSGFSVTGSPVTSTGTLGITTALSGVVAGTGSGLTAATSANVLSLWTGTCSSATFMRGDGSCQVVGAGASPANPSGLIGMSAVNGVAATFGRSDGTHAIDPAIVPTWTGVHSFTSTSGTVFGAATGDNTLRLFATGGATNAKNTLVRTTSAGSFSVTAATDAAPTTATTAAFSATRTGGAWTALTYGNSTDNPTHTFSGTGAASFGGPAVFANASAAVASPNISLTASGGGIPTTLEFFDAAGPTNGKIWDIYSNAATLGIAAVLDNRTSPVSALIASRSAGAITSVAFPATTGASLLVGTTSSISASAVMNVLAPVNNAAAMLAVPTAAAAVLFTWNQAAAGDNLFQTFFTEASPTSRGSISYNRTGNLTVYSTTSDRRLKTAIADAGSSNSLIDAIKVRQFEWREPGHSHVAFGFVAQELAEVYPDAVSIGDSGEDVVKAWQVDKSTLVPLLVKELQELRARVAELEAERTLH